MMGLSAMVVDVLYTFGKQQNGTNRKVEDESSRCNRDHASLVRD